jgi:hypothetical protein
MDILVQVKLLLGREETEHDEKYQESLRTLYRRHDICLMHQDWQGAYQVLREILKVVIKENQRQGIM